MSVFSLNNIMVKHFENLSIFCEHMEKVALPLFHSLCIMCLTKIQLKQLTSRQKMAELIYYINTIKHIFFVCIFMPVG